jgi:hypothetical protein
MGSEGQKNFLTTNLKIDRESGLPNGEDEGLNAA